MRNQIFHFLHTILNNANESQKIKHCYQGKLKKHKRVTNSDVPNIVMESSKYNQLFLTKNHSVATSAGWRSWYTVK